MNVSLRLLLIGSETIDDRRLIESILGLPTSAAIECAVQVSEASAAWLKGDDVLVVAQAPGPTYVPLRFGRLHANEASTVGGSVSVTVAGYPDVPDRSVVQTYLEGRVRHLGPRLTEAAPPLRQASDPGTAWRAAAQAIWGASPRFANSCFLRVQSIEPSETAVTLIVEAIAAPGVESLGEGVVLAIDMAGTTIDMSQAAAEFVVSVPREIAAVRIELQHPELTGQIAAVQLSSLQSSATAPMHVVAAPVQRTPKAASGQAYDTYSFLVSSLQLSPAVRAEVAERLAILGPDDRRLAVHRAKALLESGQAGRAVEVLRDIPEGERTSEVHALLVDAVLATGDVEGAEPHLIRAAFDAWTFDQLVQATETLPQAVRDGLVMRLCTVLASDRMAELVSRIGHTLSPGPQLTTIAARVAESSPADALALLERSGPVDQMPTEALSMIMDLRLELDPSRVGESAIELSSRLVRAGDLDGASSAAAKVLNAVDWREAGAIADLLIDGLQRLGPSAWSEAQDYQALVAAELATFAVRGARDVDLLDAFDISARLRQALTPLAPLAAGMLDGLDAELVTAWEASDAHRLAIAELVDARMQELRGTFANKRLLVVGGRISDWWEALQEELALDRSSSWIEVEPGRKPQQDSLKARVAGGKTSLLVIMVDYIGHSTSAIGNFAKDRKIPVVEARSGRASMVRALERAAGQFK